jgi:FtsP/CotA-like multicopper oxidase with cupredoxin domain
VSRQPGTVEVGLTASPRQLALAPGKVTEAYTFYGSVPGPSLEVYEGDHVIVHFRNELPEPTTIRWHGLRIPAVMDGSPLRPVAPGASYAYVFTVKRGSAGTYWYHPHPDGRSGYQIAKGLFGAVIVSTLPKSSVPIHSRDFRGTTNRNPSDIRPGHATAHAQEGSSYATL